MRSVILVISSLVLLSLCPRAQAQQEETEGWRWEADLGISAHYVRGFIDDSYDEKGEVNLAVLLIGGVYYDDFYLELSPHTRHPLTLGYKLQTTAKSQLSLVAESYFVSVTDNESRPGDKLYGIDDRLASLEGGIEYLREFDTYEVRVRLLHDMLDRHNGTVATLEIARPIFTRKVFYLPSVGLTYISSKATDYYFGVRANEVTEQRPAYQASSGMIGSVRLYAERPMGDNWSLVGFASYNLINAAIADSPIVNPHKDAFNIGIGAVWSF